jgi:FkbM family methyltransferase
MAATTDERAALDAMQLTRFAEAIRPGDVVADIGAYRGTYALVAAAIAGPTGRVFAFEPTATNAALIARNVALNGFAPRMTVEQAAVSDRTGTATFYAAGDATTNSLASSGGTGGTQVRTIALDEYFAGQQPPRVLKIDIEGAELLALRGAQHILASDAWIICELHPYAWGELGYSGDDLRGLLASHGRFTADLATGEERTDYRYGAVLLARRG